MNFLAKNSWLNFIVGLTGFYFVFSIMQIIMGHFGARMVAVTPAAGQLNGDYYWLVSFIIALIVAMLITIIFCKPREPFFVFMAVLIAGALAMYRPLYITIVSLDKNVRKEGLVALYDLLPHLVVFVGALIALYTAWLSNRIGGNTAE